LCISQCLETKTENLVFTPWRWTKSKPERCQTIIPELSVLGKPFKFRVDLHISLLEVGTDLNYNHSSFSCLGSNFRLRERVYVHFSKQTYLGWKFIISVPDYVV
jgi:hypothetical protein